ncbi:hypothetical protein DFQ28_000908 [Apophysomyces sp. BC1034]|nr:hypothetical protein DFQ30_003085 [Apophysomyces sp. BC1015]KAG0180713.1 hypothetical protein DFQ29_000112 [Apophysomyces sp. BC1021]KAG0191109.1 hypothetical protein DFQ28_000908 [Apophysomyces sp. BC1034]
MNNCEMNVGIYSHRYHNPQQPHHCRSATEALLGDRSYRVCNDQDQYPSYEAFDAIVQEYLTNLSSKKRDKALVDQHRYSLILQVLKDPRNTAISTAQFRFWVKKMFQLVQLDGMEIVCHDNKPVAMREQIYDILVRAHREAHHGGRDKTSALVRRRYSWIPKELIARFVRHCPFCISRRNGSQSPPMCVPKTPPAYMTRSPPPPSFPHSFAADDTDFAFEKDSKTEMYWQQPCFYQQQHQQSQPSIPCMPSSATAPLESSFYYAFPQQSYDCLPTAAAFVDRKPIAHYTCEVDVPHHQQQQQQQQQQLQQPQQQQQLQQQQPQQQPQQQQGLSSPSCSSSTTSSEYYMPTPTSMPYVDFMDKFTSASMTFTTSSHDVVGHDDMAMAAAAAAMTAAAGVSTMPSTATITFQDESPVPSYSPSSTSSPLSSPPIHPPTMYQQRQMSLLSHQHRYF